ncbi:hypothetical protein AB0C34_25285 [Nocardia sp. NPDC049220]
MTATSIRWHVDVPAATPLIVADQPERPQSVLRISGELDKLPERPKPR